MSSTCQANKENAPHELGHYLILVAWYGIKPPTQGFQISSDGPLLL